MRICEIVEEEEDMEDTIPAFFGPLRAAGAPLQLLNAQFRGKDHPSQSNGQSELSCLA